MTGPTELPKHSRWLFRWFRWYAARDLARSFHAVRLAKSSAPLPVADGSPLVVVTNHPGWWDLMLGFGLAGHFPGYRFYAPIESVSLAKYRFLARLGLFGIDPGLAGARQFLRTCRAIFERPYSCLWITAQGRFADPRERPLDLRPGIGHLAASLPNGYVVPIALEYPFWDERTPEALVRVGEPLRLGDTPTMHRDGWLSRITDALTDTMDRLAADSLSRDPARFEVLVAGKAGTSRTYDTWRRINAWSRGRRYRPEHRDELPS